jgi:RND family efflux transporter MFP subunit
MMRSSAYRVVLSGVLAAALLGAAQTPDTSKTSFDAHTEPSARSEANFSAPGVVAEVLVKAGEVVKKGQPMVRLDDRGDRKLLESLELEAKSTLKIEASKADLAQKRLELAQKEQQLGDGGASKLEVEELKVAVLIREFQVQIEELTHQQKILEADRQRVRVEQMTLSAPIDGVVERVDLDPGETPDMQRPAFAVVNNSPLWINVFLPTSVTIKFKKGDNLNVTYKDTGEAVKGKVIFLSPVADAASESRLVRLELANPNDLPSGLAVQVEVPGVAAKPTAAR